VAEQQRGRQLMVGPPTERLEVGEIVGRLRDQVASSLAETVEQTDPGSGPWVLRRADMYLGDIEKFCTKTFTDHHLELAFPVYVLEEKASGGDVVTLNKKREGVFVLGDRKIILARALSFSRTQTADYDISSAKVEPIDMVVEGESRPGFRLNLPAKVASYAIGLAPPSMDNVAVVAELRDRVIQVLGGRT